MNHRCLSREEYKEVIDYLLHSQCIENEELSILIQSAIDNWDINIICLLYTSDAADEL